ncbi:hypothetical protein [Thauera humireducens]|uniref:Uncharacterized protein n=1 Tax=Thauera humireducens TaxID=1134435 RepID=A0A127K6U5_9RHOO|nr:hypothetical protein [Thauera humireducens]AMO37680.1 hypothetical protein AC731_012435 [Thauera humireducens]
MNLHPAILEHVAHAHGDLLAAPPQLNQDALTIGLRNGVTLTVRYAASDAYSLRWRTGMTDDAAELCIDTAPTHPHLTTAPNHLHCADGAVVADPVTRIDASPEANVSALLVALASDPLLGASA